jgi:hypothetical protein
LTGQLRREIGMYVFGVQASVFLLDEDNVGTIVSVQLQVLVKELGEEVHDICFNSSPEILVKC